MQIGNHCDIISLGYPGMAQLVARLTGGQEAVSSSLATRTKQRGVPLVGAPLCFIQEEVFCWPLDPRVRLCLRAPPVAETASRERRSGRNTPSDSEESVFRAPQEVAVSSSLATRAKKKRWTSVHLFFFFQWWMEVLDEPNFAP